MNTERLEISAGAVFAATAICVFFDMYSILAVLLPVMIHELSHVIVLRMFGMKIRSISFQLRGICIRYSGSSGVVGDIIAAGSGPAAGLLYALTASRAGVMTDSSWLCLSAGVSLLLSVYNLLPAMPLDGGRIFFSIACVVFGEKKGEIISSALGTAVGALLLVFGLTLMKRGQGIALTAAAVWILLCQRWGAGIVKRREVL